MMLFNPFEPLELVEETTEIMDGTMVGPIDAILQFPSEPLELNEEKMDVMDDVMDNKMLVSSPKPFESIVNKIVKKLLDMRMGHVKVDYSPSFTALDLQHRIQEAKTVISSMTSIFLPEIDITEGWRKSMDSLAAIDKKLREQRERQEMDIWWKKVGPVLKQQKMLCKVIETDTRKDTYTAEERARQTEGDFSFAGVFSNFTLPPPFEKFECIDSSEFTDSKIISNEIRYLEVQRGLESIRNIEDYLTGRDNLSPLPSYDRICILRDLCNVLIYIHSFNIKHGDLRPENILLSSNLKCKLTGAGKGWLQEHDVDNAIFFEKMFPNGTYSYVDPEYMITGKLTHLSDIYSFGVIALRMLTGRSPVGLVIDMKEALVRDNLEGVLDQSAGKWPLEEIKQLVKIALKCCEILGENRPDLAEVLNVLGRTQKALYHCSFCILGNQIISEEVTPPSYFICPILRDVMTDPVIAADGYTYEREAIKMWIESGHNTSPMTNLELPNNEIVPNYGLRSAIKEWTMEHKVMLDNNIL